MTWPAVLCALVCAASNAAVSVLQRAAALGLPAGVSGRRHLRLLRSKTWWAGAAALGLAAVAQAAALGLGSLSLVQPLLASELLFALLIGRLVFRRSPGAPTWASFAALACGLALFLGATDPRPGSATDSVTLWIVAGLGVALTMLLLVCLARRAPIRSRAVLLGCATATGFAMTAALVKEVLARADANGLAHLALDWPPYALAVAGGGSFVLLQVTLRAGTLRLSQPALTLVDAAVSLVLGRLLFGEQVSLGARLAPAIAGAALIVAGVIGLTRSLPSAGDWDA